jgi:CheY-like chemotaxis protein
MPRILVAEDSATQGAQISGVLEEARYETVVVSDGKQALRRLEEGDKFDLVLTDMMMPELDGLQLVRAIRVHHPGIPVILMTAQGTDALAVEALEQGAAGYVPKSRLNERLIDDVAQVLHASQVNRNYELLLGCLRRNEFAFELGNNVSLFRPLIDLLQQMMSGMQLCDSTGRVRVGVALEHALVNALCWGNLEIPPQEMPNLRELMIQGHLPSVVQERLAAAPYNQRKIRLDVAMTRDEARFVVRDEGSGFDVSTVPDPGDPDILERQGGRGLLLIQTFMDEVSFHPPGNQVTMVKRRET